MAGHVWPPRRLIGRGWPKLSRRSSGQPGARSGAGTGLRRANWPKAEPPCLPHRHAEVAASLRLRSSTATLLAGRIVQLESQLSVASCRLKLVSRLQLLASALTLLVMLWRALLVEPACADDLTHTPTNIDLARLAPWDAGSCWHADPILAINPVDPIDPVKWNGTNCTAVYGTFQLGGVQALLDARLAHAERLEGLDCSY